MNRLVIVTNSFPKLSETFIVNKFAGLLNTRWDVHIVAQYKDFSTWADFVTLQKHSEWQKRIHQTPVTRPRWLFLLLFPLVFLGCWLRRPLGSWHYLHKGWQQLGWRIFYTFYLDAPLILLQPTIVHVEFGALAPERTYLKECLSCNLIVSFRGYDINYVGLDNPRYYQTVWHKADALHLLGQDLWQRAQKRGCPANKFHTLISPAIDTYFFSPTSSKTSLQVGTEDRPFRILSVGRLEWKKGYEYALQAVRLLQDQGIVCQYHIVGDGHYLESLTFARHEWQLEAIVDFMGAKPLNFVREQMEWADVLLHAAVSEGFCNAVIEAQAMAVPVVCSDADGLAENVADGVTGFVVPRRNPEALAKKLACLARDPMLRDQMGKAGRQRVIDQFQLSDQIDAFVTFYQDVLNHA